MSSPDATAVASQGPTAPCVIHFTSEPYHECIVQASQVTHCAFDKDSAVIVFHPCTTPYTEGMPAATRITVYGELTGDHAGVKIQISPPTAFAIREHAHAFDYANPIALRVSVRPQSGQEGVGWAVGGKTRAGVQKFYFEEVTEKCLQPFMQLANKPLPRRCHYLDHPWLAPVIARVERLTVYESAKSSAGEMSLLLRTTKGLQSLKIYADTHSSARKPWLTKIREGDVLTFHGVRVGDSAYKFDFVSTTATYWTDAMVGKTHSERCASFLSEQSAPQHIMRALEAAVVLPSCFDSDPAPSTASVAAPLTEAQPRVLDDDEEPPLGQPPKRRRYPNQR